MEVAVAKVVFLAALLLSGCASVPAVPPTPDRAGWSSPFACQLCIRKTKATVTLYRMRF
jgi:uncharacterized protein YceK